MEVKQHKGKLSGIAFSVLTVFMFGIMPIPMLCYGLVSIFGETITMLHLEWDPKIVGIAIATVILLTTSSLIVFQIRKSRKKFDWLIALLMLIFVLGNGIGLKMSELLNIDFSQNSYHFLTKVSVFYFWLFPVIGWYYDVKLAPQKKIED